MDELKKLEAEKLAYEIEEKKQLVKNEFLKERLLTIQIQNAGLETQVLGLEIEKLEADKRAAERKLRAYDEMESYYIQMKDVAKYQKEVWFARSHKEGIKY
jgi:hypothetical protein